jgi:hypothetical protein
LYKEVELNPELNWAIKQAKRKDEIHEVPNDIAKQYLAKSLSDYFNSLLKTIYTKEKIFMEYI